MQVNNLFITPEKIKPTKFYINLFIGLILFIGLLLGCLMIIAKFGIGASIGNSIIGTGIAFFIFFGSIYTVMENDRKSNFISL